MEQFFITAGDGLQIATALFTADNPKALVQIIHGSVEHKERYFDFATFLNKQNYAVILSDNRGQGASLNAEYTLGFMNGFQPIIDDQYLVTQHIKSLYPGKPLCLLGHSLGSVFARIYLEKHDDELAALVLSGTVNYNTFTPAGIWLAKRIISRSGMKGYNKALRKLIMNGDDISWVSYSQQNLAAYKADPLCGYHYTNSAALTLLESVRELAIPEHYQCKNPKLPILSISGEEDPVTGGKKGLERSFMLLKNIGYSNFKNIVYPHMKHEVLNEDDHRIVYQDVFRCFEDHVNEPAAE